MKNLFLFIFFLFSIYYSSFGQNINPFTIRYQVNLKGGMVLMGNTYVKSS